MSFLPIFSVKNYPEMLAKLGWYAFTVALFSIFMLREYVQPVTQLSRYIDDVFPQELAGAVPFPISLAGVFVLAVGIALIAHSFKLHILISSALRIRAEFDVNFVLYPLAIASGAKLTSAHLTKIENDKNRLMYSAFYAYVSSTEPKTDRHTITQALTNWSWHWVCLETTAILGVTAIVLAIYDAGGQAASLLIVCAVLLLFMRFFRLQSAEYARRQVEQILQDATRRTAVAAEFNAL